MFQEKIKEGGERKNKPLAKRGEREREGEGGEKSVEVVCFPRLSERGEIA